MVANSLPNRTSGLSYHYSCYKFSFEQIHHGLEYHLQQQVPEISLPLILIFFYTRYIIWCDTNWILNDSKSLYFILAYLVGNMLLFNRASPIGFNQAFVSNEISPVIHDKAPEEWATGLMLYKLEMRCKFVWVNIKQIFPSLHSTKLSLTTDGILWNEVTTSRYILS